MLKILDVTKLVGLILILTIYKSCRVNSQPTLSWEFGRLPLVPTDCSFIYDYLTPGLQQPENFVAEEPAQNILSYEDSPNFWLCLSDALNQATQSRESKERRLFQLEIILRDFIENDGLLLLVPGPQGPTGPMGPPGPNGVPGPPGDWGQDGAPGVPGLMGNTGSTGFTGLMGRPGSISGFVGNTGVPGSTGPMGATGPFGFTGAKGTRGPHGKSGAPGHRGKPGPPGPPGDTGSMGPTTFQRRPP